MTALALGWFALCTAGWMVIRRRQGAVVALAPGSRPGNDRVSVVIPARDEARSIEACVTSLLTQEHPPLEVIVVDDGSTDATASLAAEAGATVIPAPPLPAGWAGKPHACTVGADAASGDWLLFVDADTVADPRLVASTVAHAENQNLDMLSPHPFQEVVTFWERVILPAGFLLLLGTRNIARINDPERRGGAVNGQCVLVRTEAYRRIGGHEAVRDEILEDLALGTVAKQAGLRLQVVDGAEFIRTRMYRSLGEIWRGLTKNAAIVAGGPVLASVASIGLVLAAAAPVALPVLTAISGPPWAAAVTLGGTAILADMARRIPRYYGLSAWWAASLPLGVAASGVITGASAIKTFTRTREWKGRRF